MDKLSPEEFQGYVDKFPEFQEKMANLVKKYNYKYPEQPGTIPKFVDTENGRYTLIEETGGQMCDDLECTMIGHCVIKNDEDSYNPGTEFFYSEMSEYYKTLPIYTKMEEYTQLALRSLMNMDYLLQKRKRILYISLGWYQILLDLRSFEILLLR